MENRGKKALIKISLRTIIILLLLFAIYYFLILSPRIEAPQKLSEAEKILTTHMLTLSQNRLALREMTRLKVDGSNFDTEKDRLLNLIKETNKEGQEKLKEKQDLPEIDEELSKAFTDLLAQTAVFYQDEIQLINFLEDFDQSALNLFSYNPEADLGSLIIEEQKEELKERASRTKEGLENVFISLSLKEISTPEITQLLEQIATTQVELDELIFALNNSSDEEVNSRRADFTASASNLDELSFDVILGLIRSNSSIALITSQTNLILEYEFWLERITELQRELES